MKHSKIILLSIFCTIAIFSCSNESTDEDITNSSNLVGDYFPSTTEDYWKYDVSNTDNLTGETIMSNDSLYVVSEIASTFSLGVNDNMIANGAMNALLTSGELTRTQSTLSLNGNLALPPELANLIDFEIVLNDVILYDINASSGTELSANSNTITQDFNGFPVTITYHFTTKSEGFQNSLSLNGQDYTNVTASELALNLQVSASVPVGPITVDVNILEPQDVLISTNYFVEDIGLVHAQTNTSYEVSATTIALLEQAGIALDVPTSGSTSNLQVLTDYSVSQ